MASVATRITADCIKPGDLLPTLRVPITATTVVMGASATRDWQPQHHDRAWATERARARDIFLNTPTQAGWISRYITDWTGMTGRLGRVNFRMKSTICPGDLMVMTGVVKRVFADVAAGHWVELAIDLKVGEVLATTCTASVSVPASVGAESPWQRKADRWRLPSLEG
jgi:hypothetical protein